MTDARSERDSTRPIYIGSVRSGTPAARRRFLSNLGGVGDAFLGGWQITAINNAVSGRTINLTYNNGGAFTVIPGLAVFGRPAYRPNLSGDPLTPEAERGPNNYLNRATVSAPRPSMR
jgi:hypothetical protein